MKKGVKISVKCFFICILSLSLNLLSAQQKDLNKAFEQGPTEKLTSTREEISLNGLWHFCPAGNINIKPAAEEYVAIWVPGAWFANNPWWTTVPGIHNKGKGEAWEKDLNEVRKVWYKKDIYIPPEWTESKILVDFDKISTDAVVFINESVIDTINWPGGMVDITNYVEPGKSYNLNLLVIATAEKGNTFKLMGTADAMVTKLKSTLTTGGITGEVYMKTQPKSIFISDVFVQTSVRKKQIKLDIEISDCQKTGKYLLKSVIVDKNGKSALVLSESVYLPEGKRNKVRLSEEWSNPELWDLDKPILYSAITTIEKGSQKDEVIQEFGFREFWIDGKDFYLNGAKINLKPNNLSSLGGMTEMIDTGIVNMRKCGFNFIEIWPQDFTQRGMVDYNKQFVNRASKKGMLVAAPLPRATKFIMDDNWQFIWDKEGMKEGYEKEMLPVLKQLRNEPSIVFWVMNPNFFGHEDDQNPVNIGRKGWIQEDISWQQRSIAGQECGDIVKKHDSTRPVFNHHGTYTSDIHTMNHYLCFLPLQEREEWLSHYRDFGTMPYMAVELGTPLENTFLRARAHFGFSIHSEPLFTEFAAAYLGHEAYTSETHEYKQQIKDYFIGGQKYENWQGNPINQRLPAHQAIQKLFVTNTWRSWRTYGISGGMLPWMDAHGWAPKKKSEKFSKAGDFAPGRKGTYVESAPLSKIHFWSPEYWIEYPAGTALRENNNTTLAYIAGKENDFTEKDHSFHEGGHLQKQVILISDYRVKTNYRWECVIIVEDDEVGNLSGKGEINPAMIEKIPIAVKMPESVSSEKAQGFIALEAKIGNRLHTDTFHFRVFQKPLPVKSKMTCFDPIGKTRKMIEDLGLQVEEWTGEHDVEHLIIGRRTLSAGFDLPADIEMYVKNGGRVMIMAQNPKWIEKNMGFRMSKYVSRYVFPVNQNHAVMKGLDEMDLRNWNGKGTLVKAYPEYQTQTVKEGQYGVPYYGWHWGNNGSVTSAAIEKPHKSSWRPLLECEFDLAYTPLMEMEYGKGKIILNTLDLEDNYECDPAAGLLARNILQYLQTSKPVSKPNRVEFIGNEKNKKFLDELGLIFKETETINNNSDILIISDISKINENELKKYLRKGGKVLCLYNNCSEGILNVKYKTEKQFDGSINIPDWHELRGISPSDTRWRTYHDSWILNKGCEIGADGLFGKQKVGKGTILFCQLNPEALNADSLTFFRYTRWRQTRALSQILANMGCTIKSDAGIFNFNKNTEYISLEGRWKAKLTNPKPVTISVVSTIEDAGISTEAQKLIQPKTDDSDMQKVVIPMEMENFGKQWTNANGEAVFRKTITIPESFTGRDLILDLGVIDDYDKTWFNGRLVGEVKDDFEEFWGYCRKYKIPKDIVKKGENIITIRVYDRYGKGGLLGSEDEMRIYPEPGNMNQNYYHPDYRDDFKLGDDPFRYFRW